MLFKSFSPIWLLLSIPRQNLIQASWAVCNIFFNYIDRFGHQAHTAKSKCSCIKVLENILKTVLQEVTLRIKNFFFLAVNYFRKMLYIRCLTGFWIQMRSFASSFLQKKKQKIHFQWLHWPYCFFHCFGDKIDNELVD